jgi:hypothetical protein
MDPQVANLYQTLFKQILWSKITEPFDEVWLVVKIFKWWAIPIFGFIILKIIIWPRIKSHFR